MGCINWKILRQDNFIIVIIIIVSDQTDRGSCGDAAKCTDGARCCSAELIGRTTRLARLSLRLSVCSVPTPNSKTNKCMKANIGANVARGTINRGLQICCSNGR